jgi:hypothetical protein
MGTDMRYEPTMITAIRLPISLKDRAKAAHPDETLATLIRRGLAIIIGEDFDGVIPRGPKPRTPNV